MSFIKKTFNSNLNPFEIYTLFKKNKNAVILDSSKEDKKLSRFSFIGLNQYLIFESYEERAYIDNVLIDGEPFKILESLLNKYKLNIKNDEIPFIAGCIGYMSYDTGRIIEELPNTALEDFKIPDMRFIFYKNIIIYDIEQKQYYITDLDGDNERVE